MIFYLIFIGLIISLNNQQVDCISCKNLLGLDVGFYLIIKPPLKESTGGEKGYLYKAQGDEANRKWTYVKKDITADELPVTTNEEFKKLSPIGKTLNHVYQQPEEYQYILYNNKIPKELKIHTLSPKSETHQFGNGKGALIWDRESAIFIVHSAEKFLPPFSKNLRKYFSRKGFDSHGHSLLCISLSSNDVSRIVKHLIIIKSAVYDKHLTEDGEEKLRNSQLELYGVSNIPPRHNNGLTRTRTRTRSRTRSIDSHSSSSRDSRTSHAIESHPKKSNAEIVTMKLDKIQLNSVTELETKLESTKFEIISKSHKESIGLWDKIKLSIKLNFFIKPHSSKLTRSCSIIKGIRINDIDAIRFDSDYEKIKDTQRIHWNYDEDRFNFGFHRNSQNGNFIYCHTDIDDRGLRNKAGLALCLKGAGVNDLTEIVENTAVKKCSEK